MHVIHFIGTPDSSGMSRTWRQLQAGSSAWVGRALPDTRRTAAPGCCFRRCPALAVPLGHNLSGVPPQMDTHVQSFPSFCTRPPEGSLQTRMGTPPASPQRQAAGETTPSAQGWAGGGAVGGLGCQEPSRSPRRDSPASAGARCVSLVCLSRIRLLGDPHPGTGGGKGSEHRVPRRPPRSFRPGEGGPLWGGAPICLRRYLCPGLPSASRGGPGGGRLPGGAPGRGDGLAAAAAWPGRGTTSAPLSRRGPEAGGTEMGDPKWLQSPDPNPWGKALGGKMAPRCPPWGAACPGRPSEARRGHLSQPPLPPWAPWGGQLPLPAPPSPRREKPAAGQTWQAIPPAFPSAGCADGRREGDLPAALIFLPAPESRRWGSV